MVRFAEVFPDEQIMHALSAQLGWTHFRLIIYLNLTELPPKEVLQQRFHEAIAQTRARLAQSDRDNDDE